VVSVRSGAVLIGTEVKQRKRRRAQTAHLPSKKKNLPPAPGGLHRLHEYKPYNTTVGKKGVVAVE
jgi:hypothetical protein